MRPFLYSFFHRETNDRSEKGMVNIPKDRNVWPEAWKTVEYKEYELFPKISLLKATGHISRISKSRETKRIISPQSLSLETLSYILECGQGVRDVASEKRLVASGGSRYPLETYVFVFKSIDGLEPGIYHYSVRTHELEVVRKINFSLEQISSLSSYKWLKDTTGVICLSAVFKRSVQKYGSRAYRYILLEAGHIGQNILMAAAEKNTLVIPIGGFNEEEAEKMIGLLSSGEKIIYAIYLQ